MKLNEIFHAREPVGGNCTEMIYNRYYFYLQTGPHRPEYKYLIPYKKKRVLNIKC